MAFTFDELEGEYKAALSSMKLIKPVQAKLVAERLLKNRDRFLNLHKACGVPALWTMAVFEREGPNFEDYLGNGDPLKEKTLHVPRGRGPFASWEDGAADALHLDEVTTCAEWRWEAACWEWERWNGFGPRMHDRPSGYLWSGTDHYHGGKYVADGVWSRKAWDQQLGTVIIAKAIAAVDPEVAAGFVS